MYIQASSSFFFAAILSHANTSKPEFIIKKLYAHRICITSRYTYRSTYDQKYENQHVNSTPFIFCFIHVHWQSFIRLKWIRNLIPLETPLYYLFYIYILCIRYEKKKKIDFKFSFFILVVFPFKIMIKNHFNA